MRYITHNDDDGVQITSTITPEVDFVAAASRLSGGSAWVEVTAPPAAPPDYAGMLDRYMDQVAKVRGYDNRLTCALRAGYAGPFQADGRTFAQWMDACYVAAAKLGSGAAAGADPRALLAQLPTPPWPL